MGEGTANSDEIETPSFVKKKVRFGLMFGLSLRIHHPLRVHYYNKYL